ncbi:MAG: hypothetical protein L7F77_12300 [Candidatus Magnetominusculus sp. LBB02]|nr:hypothetical protein [Candidatus Magnetominusculus sp. LBB02]
MTEGFQVLKGLFNENILGNPIRNKGRSFVDLKEKEPQAKLKNVTLLGIPDDTIVIKLDEYIGEVNLFKHNRGLLRRCDYVIFSKTKDKDIIVFIELKSFKPKNEEIIQKFKSSLCIVDYCKAILKHFYNDTNPLDSFTNHFILFYKNNLNKTPTSRKQPNTPKKGCTPDNYKKKSVNNNDEVELRSILCST